MSLLKLKHSPLTVLNNTKSLLYFFITLSKKKIKNHYLITPLKLINLKKINFNVIIQGLSH